MSDNPTSAATPAPTPAPTPTPGQVDTDRIVRAVAQARTIRDSVFALLHHIAGEIRAAWEDNTPAAKDAVLEFLDASKARIADAVSDNTDQNIFPNRAPGQAGPGAGQTSVSRDRDLNLPAHLHQPPGGVIIAGVSQMPSEFPVPGPVPAINPEAPIRAPGDPLPNAGAIEQTPHPDAVRAAIEAHERATSGEPVPDATVSGGASGTATETRNEDQPHADAAPAAVPVPASRDENEVFGDTNPPAAAPAAPASPASTVSQTPRPGTP